MKGRVFFTPEGRSLCIAGVTDAGGCLVRRALGDAQNMLRATIHFRDHPTPHSPSRSTRSAYVALHIFWQLYFRHLYFCNIRENTPALSEKSHARRMLCSASA